MEEEEIAKLCKSLKLSEEEGVICKIEGSVFEEGSEEVKHCLVGKVLGARRVNREGFKTVIEQIWGAFGVVEVESLGNNCFMFYFGKTDTKELVWNRGPWHFENNLLVLERPEGAGDVSKLAFDRLPIWVQIHKLPLMCMNPGVARVLAGQIGKIVWVPEESRECRGKFLRVKVCIDLSKPLKRVLQLNLGGEGETKMVFLSYENLPEFCFTCGRVGHGGSECRDEEAREQVSRTSKREYGSWLRASQSVWGRRKSEGLEPEGDRRGRRNDFRKGVDREKKGGARALVNVSREQERLEGVDLNGKGVDSPSSPHEVDRSESVQLVEGVPAPKASGMLSGEPLGLVDVNTQIRSLMADKKWEVGSATVGKINEEVIPDPVSESAEASHSVDSVTDVKTVTVRVKPCKIPSRKWKRAARDREVMRQDSSLLQQMRTLQQIRKEGRSSNSISPGRLLKLKGKAGSCSPIECTLQMDLDVEGGTYLKRKKLTFTDEGGGVPKRARRLVVSDSEVNVVSAVPESQARREP